LISRKYSAAFQYIISLITVLMAALGCYLFIDLINYKIVALLLLMVVSLLAMLFDIFPVLLAALLSALAWNFLFIPPLFTFHIGDTEDILIFMMYFVIACVNAVLTIKIRKVEKTAVEKEEKEKTIKLYNTLLSSLSHELRTPIATILGAVDTLKDSNNKLSDKNKGALLEEIDIASVRLNRQVKNLLNMSRLESGIMTLHLDWSDVNETVFGIIGGFPVTTHRFIFEPDETLPLYKLDGGLLEQVLHNILHNAIQYTPDGSKINIELKGDDQNCLIIISDNGGGFPENEIESVFEKFYRLPDSKAGGTGLGLSIAKGYIEAHGGTILLENIPSGGARFTLNIPAEASYLNHLKNE
jgi:two-component system sensor histidine kinase KdpD